MQSRQTIYTFEHPTLDQINNLICGDPWSFQDTKSASELFSVKISETLGRTIDPVFIKPWMKKGVLVMNKSSKYIQFGSCLEKHNLSDYTVLL